LIGAAAWAAITVATNYQIGFMAVGVGFLCGITVGKVGRGSAIVFGLIGAGCALLGCVLGNLGSAFGAVAYADDVSFWSILSSFDYSMTFELLAEMFSPMDLLFYGIAVYEGFKFGSRAGEAGSAEIQPA
jgi:hypothetical protein